MNALIFIEGFLIGFFLCAPIGPIGIFCARQTLLGGPIVGCASVLGASTADLIYCAAAGFGVTFAADLIGGHQGWFRLFGALVLIVVGIKLLLSDWAPDDLQGRGPGIVGAYTSTLLLMLANPLPILVFAAAFTTLGQQGWDGGYWPTAVFVLGAFSGSAAWCPLLVTIVGLSKSWFKLHRLRWINRASGALILAFGLSIGLTVLISASVTNH